MPRSSCFRRPFGSQNVHEAKTVLNNAREDLHSNFAVIQHILSQKTSVLVTSEILGVFGNTLSGDDVYYPYNLWKFSQHVKTPLSQKRENIFSNFYCIFAF